MRPSATMLTAAWRCCGCAYRRPQTAARVVGFAVHLGRLVRAALVGPDLAGGYRSPCGGPGGRNAGGCESSEKRKTADHLAPKSARSGSTAAGSGRNIEPKIVRKRLRRLSQVDDTVVLLGGSGADRSPAPDACPCR